MIMRDDFRVWFVDEVTKFIFKDLEYLRTSLLTKLVNSDDQYRTAQLQGMIKIIDNLLHIDFDRLTLEVEEENDR